MSVLKHLKNNTVALTGLVLFAIAFSVILVKSISPSLHLIGWDNFSISLDFTANGFRTLFSTWREYRGLGVPGDSESVDIFRLVIQAILSVFVPDNIINQIYYLALYALGVLSSFFLAKHVFSEIAKKKGTGNSTAVFYSSAITALAYGFNYHVLETFLLPVAMYPARYAFFPLIVWSFLKLLDAKTIKPKYIAVFIAANLLGSTAYLTATVFITLAILLFSLLPSFRSNFKRYFVLGFSILLLNSFWVFPFANYSVQKAGILPRASSFTSVNESLLNKPAENYSWRRILLYDPMTLSQEALPFKDLSTGEPTAIHTLVETDNQQSMKISLLFPLYLAIIGVISILWFSHRHKTAKYLWPILLVVIMLFLLRKEYPPFGIIYSLLTRAVPFFEVIFRFSGTKFYSLLLMGMSLLAGWGFLLVASYLPFGKNKKNIVIPLLVAVYAIFIIFPFRSFFTGGIYGSLVKVELPESYSQMAEYLNNNEVEGRVLHLPVDQYSYWKSYNWGYFGSSFLSFMLDKPLLDRTFEPASLENDYYFSQLHSEINSISKVSDQEAEERIRRIENLFAKTGTKYVVFDSSVDEEIKAEGLKAWGVFNKDDHRLALQKLAEKGVLQLVEQYPLPNEESLQLFVTVTGYQPARVISEAKNIDPELENGFSQPLLNTSGDFIQSGSRAFETYPLWQQKHTTSIHENYVLVEYPIGHSGTIAFNSSEQQPAKIFQDVYVSMWDREVHVFLQPRLYPLEYEFNQEQSDEIIFTDLAEAAGFQYALFVGKEIIPLENLSSGEVHHLGTFLLGERENISLLSSIESNSVSVEQIALTDNPNCYGDKGEGYDYSFEQSLSTTKLSTSDGRTCLSIPLKAYSTVLESNDEAEEASQYIFDTKMSYSLSAQDKAQETTSAQNNLGIKNHLKNMPGYASAEICIFDIETGNCLNNANTLGGSQQARTTNLWTVEKTVLPQVQMLIIVPSDANTETTFKLEEIRYSVYTTIAENIYERSLANVAGARVSFNQSESLVLTFPLAGRIRENSAGSDIVFGRGTCSEGERLVKVDDMGRVLVNARNCPTSLHISEESDQSVAYLWLAKYKLFAGRHPTMTVSQGPVDLYEQYISRFNLYPDIPGFKELAAYSSAAKELAEDDYYLESGIVGLAAPRNSESSHNITFSLNTFSEGWGLVGVELIDAIKIPEYWQDLTVRTGENNYSFHPAEVTEYIKILPSFWKVSVKLNSAEEIEGQGQPEEVLLELAQAYDDQWELYGAANAPLAFLGFGSTKTEQVRVNGWSNGWIIPADNFPESREMTYYILYKPERLAIVGWIITLGTSGVLIAAALRQKKQVNHGKRKHKGTGGVRRLLEGRISQ